MKGKIYKKLDLAKLRCNEYGFECDFVTEGEIEKVIEEFGQHTEEMHGIDYSKEVLMGFILRKSTWIQTMEWHNVEKMVFNLRGSNFWTNNLLLAS